MSKPKQKLSHWFPSDVKPVHIGAYEVFSSGYYAWWNGKTWGLFAVSTTHAYKARKGRNSSQYKPWRGIVK